MQRLRNDDGLFVDFLRHEVRVIALVGDLVGRPRGDDRALDAIVAGIVDLDRLTRDRDPIAFLEIRDPLRQRGERQRVGADEILALAIADGQRRTEPGADQQIGMGAEHHAKRKRAVKPRQNCSNRGARFGTAFDLPRDQMRDDFTIGLRLEVPPLGAQFVAERLEILDDAVVNQHDVADDVRMRIVLGRGAVGGPARMRNAAVAGQRAFGELGGKVEQLAGGAAAVELAVVDRADAGRVIAAIFEPPQPIEQAIGDRALPQDTDNSAHLSGCLPG